MLESIKLRKVKGFTLIELLIVVAIIAILAAIALPNFLEAQTRAKVSRIKADMRTLVIGLESYRVDNNGYPPRNSGDANDNGLPDEHVVDALTRLQDMGKITTPIAYLTSIPEDIFSKMDPPLAGQSEQIPFYAIEYWDDFQTSYFQSQAGRGGFMLLSVGPDRYYGHLVRADRITVDFGYQKPPTTLQGTYKIFYDPTNGTISSGNIIKFNQNSEPKEGELVVRTH